MPSEQQVVWAEFEKLKTGQVVKGSTVMSFEAITTAIKMMESLPEVAQDRVVEHLREYLEDLQDELQWDESFKKTQPQLKAAAQRAKQEIREGLAQPMNYDKL